MRRSRSTLTIAAVGAMAFLAPATGAYALWSASATGTVAVTVAAPATALAAPSNVGCTGGQGSPSVLTWSAVPGATEYRIYRAEQPATPIRTVGAPATSASFVESDMDDSGQALSPSQKYDLVLRAFNASGGSGNATFKIQFKPNGGCAG
jgi:hypothetical protein